MIGSSWPLMSTFKCFVLIVQMIERAAVPGGSFTWTSTFMVCCDHLYFCVVPPLYVLMLLSTSMSVLGFKGLAMIGSDAAAAADGWAGVAVIVDGVGLAGAAGSLLSSAGYASFTSSSLTSSTVAPVLVIGSSSLEAAAGF